MMVEPATKKDLKDLGRAFDDVHLTLKKAERSLTIRFGVMLAVAFGALALFLKLS